MITSYKKIRVGDSYRLSWTSNGQREVYSARCAGNRLDYDCNTFISTIRNVVSVAAYPFRVAEQLPRSNDDLSRFRGERTEFQ